METSKWYIYGLSANPPTNAHLEIIKGLSTLGGDVTVFPSYNHPIKTNLIDFNHRVNMLRLICEPFDNVCVSTLEERIEVPTTYDLISYLRAHVPSYKRTIYVIVCDYVIMMDFLDLKRNNAAYVLDSNDIEFCVVLNQSNDLVHDKNTILQHENSISKNISFLVLDTIDERVRSTNARRTKNMHALVPEKVYEYIQHHNIVFT